MPLFIDLHVDNNLTPDLVRQCHVADKDVQDKYGVRYLQILLNESQGYLFCLAEAPDKESCARVHQEAHGNIACNVLEITETDFTALLANKQKNALDLTLNHDGTLDTGMRAILAVHLVGSLRYLPLALKITHAAIHKHKGRTRENIENRMEVMYDSCTDAILSGIDIAQELQALSVPVEVRMGVSEGQPLERQGNFFEDVRRSAHRFAFVSVNGQITVSSKVMQRQEGGLKTKHSPVKVVNHADEKLLNRLMDCTEKIWDRSEITMEDFARELGMSKSQLARKIKSISNLSPNDFIKEFRLRKSIHLMEDQGMNIAEVTMAVGFSNPSYFTKCFKKRFGNLPSDFLEVSLG